MRGFGSTMSRRPFRFRWVPECGHAEFLVWVLLALTASSCLGQPRGSNQSQLLAPVDKSRSLPRSTPERQGISSSDILDFVDTADPQIYQMHRFLFLRRGSRAAEGLWGPHHTA